MKLFEESDDSGDDFKDNSKIEIDHNYARRFEHNKKLEDLQRFQELKKKGLVEGSTSDTDESSESDEDYDPTKVIDPKKDLEFFNALMRIRNKDPSYKKGESKLFESSSESASEDGSGSEEMVKKKRKPKYLKDVMLSHIIESGPEFKDDEEIKLPPGQKSYDEEQEELRKAFLNAAEEAFAGDDVEDFLRVKGGDDSVDYECDDEVEKKIDEYFGGDEELDDLKNIFFKKGHKQWAKNKKLSDEDVERQENFERETDDEDLERQEDFEREYNFRFEENAGDRVMGHSRFVEGSVRKKISARQLQRKNKEERMAQAEFERKEELKHLKNLKKKEMNEKLRKIRETAGFGEKEICPLDVDDLEEDFDPDEYDKKMQKAFNEEYYHADDADPGFGSDDNNDDFEKPDFDKEDELLGLPKDWDEVKNSGDGFLATRVRHLKRRVEDGSDQDQLQGEEEKASEEGKVGKKRFKPNPEEAKLKQELLEEYYKLDYEDSIGDLKTRFRYKTVNPTRYGLSIKEVLLMDDKELNQYVSLKKLAPYQEKEWKVPHIKICDQKQRNKALLRGETMDVQKTNKKYSSGLKSTTKLGEGRKAKCVDDDTPVDQSNLSRRSKRKHRQAELKLSRSRLFAYGKIPSKSKKK